MNLIQRFVYDSIDVTNPGVVTRVKSFKIVKSDWVRLVGVKCDIVYEINVLKLKPRQLDHRTEVRQHESIDDFLLFEDLIDRWNVEQRTIFRTFREILEFFRDALDWLSLGIFESFKGKGVLLQLVAAMERLEFSQIMGIEDELAKSCVYIDKALRLIISDADFCKDFMIGVVFFFRSQNKKGDVSYRPVQIPYGESVDSFVDIWVSEVDDFDDFKLAAKNMHWTKYVMLLMQNQIAESIVSISPLLALAMYKLNLRAEVIVIFCGGFFCGSYINGGTGKVNAFRKESFSLEAMHGSREVRNSDVHYDNSSGEEIIVEKEHEQIADSYRDEKEKYENFNKEQNKKHTHKPQEDIDKYLSNDEDSLQNTALVHNLNVAPIEKCGELVNMYTDKSTNEKTETKIDGSGQSPEGNSDHSTCNSLEDLPPLTSDDEKYLSYVPSDDEEEASLSGKVEVDVKSTAEGHDLKSIDITQTPHCGKKKKRKVTKKRGQKHKKI